MSRANVLRYADWSGDAPDHYLVEPKAARRRRFAQLAKEGKRAQVVDRSGSVHQLERAAKRLKSANTEDRILRVPQWDMDKAIEAMRKAGVTGAVSNLCGTKKTRVKLARF
jgi:hypothetical protein